MDNAAILDRLNKQGFAVLDPLTPEQATVLVEWFADKPVYLNAHIPETSRREGRFAVPRERSMESECICVETGFAITAPFLFERALELTDIAASYLGRDPPVCYSANAFWTRPGPAGVRPDIQDFHVDRDDDRFLVMFAFLTAVFDDEDGPQDLHGPDGTVHTIRGPAGTIFLADTSRLHRGRKPTRGERGLAWFRWGVSDRPPANVWDKIEPIDQSWLRDRYPTDHRLQESIRLLVR